MIRIRSAPWMVLALALAVAIGGCATIARTVETQPTDSTAAASPAGETVTPASPVQTP